MSECMTECMTEWVSEWASEWVYHGGEVLQTGSIVTLTLTLTLTGTRGVHRLAILGIVMQTNKQLSEWVSEWVSSCVLLVWLNSQLFWSNYLRNKQRLLYFYTLNHQHHKLIAVMLPRSWMRIRSLPFSISPPARWTVLYLYQITFFTGNIRLDILHKMKFELLYR